VGGLKVSMNRQNPCGDYLVVRPKSMIPSIASNHMDVISPVGRVQLNGSWGYV
jgi:hypothetical protein